jgi:MIP family channel proteins
MRGDYLRRGVAEFIGVFALIFVAAGGAFYFQTATDAALANGLVIAVMVSAVGFISGGHFNPAVTLAFAVTRRIHLKLALWYWLVQFGAAALAALLLRWVLMPEIRNGTHLGAPGLGSPAQGVHVSAGAGVVIEAVLTFFLVWVIFATAVDERGAFKQISGLAIGLTIALGVLMAFKLTGGAMNPARAFGPELVQKDWGSAWVWYLGPAAGAVVAGSLYELLYLRPDKPLPVVGEPDSGIDEPAPGEAAAL